MVEPGKQPGRGRAGALQQATQLQFSRNAPALPENLAVCYSSPRPIIIEKLKQSGDLQAPGSGEGLDSGGSVAFSAVSEEKLNWAVQLARRDVKRRHLEGQVKQHLCREDKAAPRYPCAARQRGGRKEPPPGSAAGPAASKSHLKLDRTSPRMEVTGSGAKVYLCMPHRVKSAPPLSDSPPTRDPGPGPQQGLPKKEERSTLEVRRLQKELQSYVQKMEELARKERSEELLDPAEELRARVWRQEQAVRSARMLYMLQQQVKEIQEDLERLSPQKIKHTKKSQAMARLAAAHRGAIRALQGCVAHLANPSKPQLASAHCRELGHLIRQLSLCSARLEVGSSVPDVAVDLLLQIEDLETLLSQKGKKRPISASQAEPGMGSSTRLPRREKKVRVPEPQKPSVARRLLPDEHGAPEENRCSSPSAAQEGLPTVQQEALGRPRQPVKTEPGRGSGPLRKRGALPTRPQGSCRSPAKPVHFQESTVAFRLKETKPPLPESRSPWVPPNPTSPLASPHRVGTGAAARTTAACSPPSHPLPGLPGRQAAGRSPRSREPVPEQERATESGRAAPGREAAARAAEGSSPARIAEEVEKAVRARLEPLLAKAQKVNLSLERNIGLQEPFWENRLAPPDVGTAAPAALPGTSSEGSALEQHERVEQEPFPALGLPDLEAMLRRMEEIECSQEAMCRRYNQILYSDPEFWAPEKRREGGDAAGGQEPRAPGPIQLTKLESRKEPQVDILLERPLDANAVEEEGDLETEERRDPRNNPALQPSAGRAPQREGSTFLWVPKNVLQSICDYGAQYEQHLKRLSHEEVGSFNPWHVAQSLAEELVEDAVGEVAGELRALCEDYAEAVFTSEFLQAAE